MAKLSVSEAAKAAGVARSTLYEKIKSGELTRGADKRIDVAELVRVFGELEGKLPHDGERSDGDGTPELSVHAEWLQELADRQQDQIERLQKTVERQSEKLAEAEERAERREQTWMNQLDRLTGLLPAPESTPEPEEPKRGFLARVFG